MGYLKTAILLAALTALFAAIGFLIGGQTGLLIALVLAFVMNFFSYWHSDRLVLSMYGAKPSQSPELQSMVSELAQHANLPTPKVYVMDNEQPNAFATGRSPEYGAIAVTQGLMNQLNHNELRGVIAHEMAHIKNRDTLIMTVTATLAGALSMLANFAMFFGISRDNEEHPGTLLGTILVAVLSPIAAMLVQMAISRTREYAADRIGAEISCDPRALASALEKIEQHAKGLDNQVAEDNPATAHLFIINPLHQRSMDNLFSTHPNTKNRIDALLELAKEMGV